MTSAPYDALEVIFVDVGHATIDHDTIVARKFTLCVRV